MLVKLLKTGNKEKIKAARGKDTLYTNRMTTKFLLGTMQDRRQWNNFFNMLKEKKSCQTKFLYPGKKISCINGRQ